MVKRYYMSRLSLYYSMPMTLLALAVFAFAWMYNKNHDPKMKIFMGILGSVLAVVMFFYYRQKLRISSSLRKVKNIEEYENGGMLERSFILEDRMLAGAGRDVAEKSTAGILQMHLEEKGRNVILHLTTAEETFDMKAADRSEAERFAAFLQRKNPQIVFFNVKPKGSGSLRDLGAGITV